MASLLTTLATSAVLASFLPAVRGHMAMWHPAAYGFNNGYEPVTPLANKGFDQWWFHGYRNERPSEVMTLTPGRDVNIEIACSKSYTSWGNSPSGDACPGDAGSYHAGGSTGSGSGWNGNSEENLTGCALAIAFKSNVWDVRPEDFTVISVQERCVRQRDTSFSIPANLPACPDGECTCAWFWQGKNSAEEMYMIGFRCRVEGGQMVASNALPRPAAPKRGGTISGPTQPMYWANSNSNLDYTPSWNTRPSYNRAFGWQNGAQTSAFGAGGSGGNTGGGDGNGNANGSTRSSASSSSSTTTRRNRPQGTQTTSTTASPSWNQHLAQPSDGEGSSNDSAASSPATTQPAPTAGGNDTQAGAGTGGNGKGKGKHCKRKLRSRAHLGHASH